MPASRARIALALATLAVLLCPAHASRARQTRLRTLDNGQYRWVSPAEIQRTERAVANGHQPWRTDARFVAAVATRRLLPGRPHEWDGPDIAGSALTLTNRRTGEVARYTLHWHHDSRAKVLLSRRAGRWMVWLRRPAGQVYWATRLAKVAAKPRR